MRIESLTFFRYVAALIVVIFHYGSATGFSGTLVAGQQMVSFFFVLSGFPAPRGDPAEYVITACDPDG